MSCKESILQEIKEDTIDSQSENTMKKSKRQTHRHTIAQSGPNQACLLDLAAEPAESNKNS